LNRETVAAAEATASPKLAVTNGDRKPA
jgi:hypothetical protein